jgi:hypothetical protein
VDALICWKTAPGWPHGTFDIREVGDAGSLLAVSLCSSPLLVD